jgi:DNA-binding NarL/FixJ family response regulator
MDLMLDTYSLHLCDDHPVLAISLSEMLKQESFVRTISVSHDFVGLKVELSNASIDLLLLDISFKGENAFDFLEEIKASYPNLKILLLTNYELSDIHLEARKFQVEGLIGKSASLEELKTACKTVLNGGEYWGKYQLSSEIIKDITPREREIMLLLVQGKTNQQISDALSISILTVQTHRKNIKAKLQLENITDLISVVNHFRLL